MIKKNRIVPGVVLKVTKPSHILAIDTHEDRDAPPLSDGDTLVVLTKPRCKYGINLVRVRHETDPTQEGELYYFELVRCCQEVGFDQAIADAAPPEKPKRQARKMPKRGFYTYEDGSEVVYCSGTRKGNKYYSPECHGPQWNDLLWTCVPGVRDIEAHYTYSETRPENTPEMK